MEHKTTFDQELSELKETITRMGLMVQTLITKAVDSLQKLDRRLAEAVVREDDEIDRLELIIDEKCVQLMALRQPEASDLRFLATAIRIVNDLERMGDLAEDVAERTIELADKPLLKPLIDIPKMGDLAVQSVALVLDAFIMGNPSRANAIWVIEKEVDRLRDQVHDELMGIMTQDASTVTRAIPLLLVSRHLERIVDHSTNIAEEVVYMIEAKVIKHGGNEQNDKK